MSQFQALDDMLVQVQLQAVAAIHAKQKRKEGGASTKVQEDNEIQRSILEPPISRQRPDNWLQV